ncbi:MAG: histidinol dehydrogenase [Arenicellales bacterium]
MKLLNTQDADFQAQLDALLDRDTPEDREVEKVVRNIIDRIRSEGDVALLEYTERFDQLSLDSASALEIKAPALRAAYESLAPDIQNALAEAADRIRDYHDQEVSQSWAMTEPDGTRLGQIIRPLDSVGVYVPGGKAAYPSSVLMTVIPAKVAGVEEIIMVVPTPNGEVNPAVLAAAHIVGVDRVFSIGGAQAVAALAYGTDTIPSVDKIVGPGNIYVATAKRMVFGKVGIDMIAGPSEVAIIADDSANADWAAMDLFAQAEHDELAQSILMTHSQAFADKVLLAIDRLLPEMERKAIIEKALKGYGAIIVTESWQASVEVSNRIAPEHLELMLDNVDEVIPFIRHAGAIFAGQYSAESLGDYCAGPNHVLPTAGTARFSSPLGVYDYQKRSSLIQASKEGADKIARIASTLARCEGLTGHARSAEYRILPK